MPKKGFRKKINRGYPKTQSLDLRQVLMRCDLTPEQVSERISHYHAAPPSPEEVTAWTGEARDISSSHLLVLSHITMIPADLLLRAWYEGWRRVDPKIHTADLIHEEARARAEWAGRPFPFEGKEDTDGEKPPA